ncbi:DUF1707 SHOCT-like domain-containing protein [Nonomuraea sp. CA-218870]|uniref:DUF1707 SHOCT-like domain-containing protein n=1 Tax=Nonomuraea sp. CA-218870 TaxID=3239998 RepID=UPI003D8ABF80
MSDLQMRASDEDRERIAQQLQQAFTEGRLDQFELEERLEKALSAKVHGDLTGLVADLPATAPSVRDVVTLESTHDHIKRAGDWAVPRRIRVASKHGGVHLDFSEAVVPHQVVEVELDLKYGSAKIILPPGASADVDGYRSDWGTTTVADVSGRRQPGVLHVVITGQSKYGALTVRYPRRRWFTQS